MYYGIVFQFPETSATGIEFACARLAISCEVVESDFDIFGLVLYLDSYQKEKKFPDGVLLRRDSLGGSFIF